MSKVKVYEIGTFNNGADPDDVLEEYGLEPDYVLDLLDECR